VTTYRAGNHHGVTICREGDGHQCGRPRHDCARGHLVAVVTNDDWALAERICALLNASERLPAGPLAYTTTEAIRKHLRILGYSYPGIEWDGALAAARAYAERPQADEFREALANLVDDDPCADYDHHGDCQTHMASIRGVCAHARAKKLLGRTERHP